MEIRIYFEGTKTLRPGFERFFSILSANARKADSEIQFVAAKDGPSGYRKAVRTHPHAWNILLKDSEQQVPARPVELCTRHGLDPLLVNNVFWMVELMESWFLADREALAEYYGKDFSTDAIGATQDVERIPKAEVQRRLKQATRDTRKRDYDKVNHAPHLLERLNAERVQEHAIHCRKLFEAVRTRLQRS